MKQTIYGVVAAAIAALLGWCFGAFVSLEPNVSRWTEIGRMFFALGVIYAAVMAAINCPTEPRDGR